MRNEFCDIIDRDNLVEKYVQGTLHGELLNQFTEHLTGCEEHSKAVALEKALNRGVREFARSELRTKLTHNISRQQTAKYYILRYAAVLLVAIVAPIVLYYQFNIVPPEDESTAVLQNVEAYESAEPAADYQGKTESLAEAPAPAPSDAPEISGSDSRQARTRSAKSQSLSETAIDSEPVEEISVPDPAASARSESLAETSPQTADVLGSTESQKSLSVTVNHQVRSAKPASAGVKSMLRQHNDVFLTPENDSLLSKIELKFSEFQDQIHSCFDENDKTSLPEINISFSIKDTGQTQKISITPEFVAKSNAGECLKEIILHWDFGEQNEEYSVEKTVYLK